MPRAARKVIALGELAGTAIGYSTAWGQEMHQTKQAAGIAQLPQRPGRDETTAAPEGTHQIWSGW